MQSKKLKVQLNSASINQAIEQLRQYRDSIEAKQERLMDVLGVYGYEIMVKKIDSYQMPFSKNDLISNVGYEAGKKSVTIYNLSDHALFVEFGTGIVGAESPHPHDTIGYSYDTNNHGNDGWYYLTDDGWFWTKGMPSRPFAHETYVELRQELLMIAREVFQQ